MSELAFDEDGQHFQVPATVTRWRIRRFNNPGRPGGAQVVYGDDGLPLFLDVDTTAEEFREAVGAVPGRYRLDGLDVHGRIVDGVPPAYLMINGPTTASGGAGYGGAGYSVPPASSATEHALVEIARINGEAFKSVADKFGNMCEALSSVVRAVDGAGLPRRAPLGPLLVDHVDQGDDEDGEDERNAAPPPAPAPPATLATMLGQVLQMVQVFTQFSYAPTEFSGPALLPGAPPYTSANGFRLALRPNPASLDGQIFVEGSIDTATDDLPPASTPEPSTLALLLPALALVGRLRRSRDR